MQPRLLISDLEPEAVPENCCSDLDRGHKRLSEYKEQAYLKHGDLVTCHEGKRQLRGVLLTAR